MRQPEQRAAWVFFAALMYLIFTDIVAHWIHLPSLGNIGFTLVFVVFSLLHCAACNGWKKTALFFLFAAFISYSLEEAGVRTGLVYGAYHYSDMLGPKLGHVPFLIPLAWFMMIYPAWVVARALLQGLETSSPLGIGCHALIAALVMTAWDTVMDPGMAAAGTWVWEQGGPYFGVPLQNYIGWLLTTFLAYLAAGVLWRTAHVTAGLGRHFSSLPVVVYACYALSYAMPRSIPALQVVAVFAMVMPALLALMRVWLSD